MNDQHNKTTAAEEQQQHEQQGISLATPDDCACAIESVLFLAGRPIDIAELQKILRVPADLVLEGISALAQSLENSRRGIRLQRAGSLAQLVTAPETAVYAATVLGMPTHAKLTVATLETLSIIAYRQPITRSQLEMIRGVNSERAVTSLTQYGLVMEVGRAATVGRPILYGTTLEFLQRFGLTSLDSLPAPEGIDELEERRRKDAAAIRQAALLTETTDQQNQ